MYAPVGTPPEVVDKVASHIEGIMKIDAFRQKAAEQGAEALFMGPQELVASTQPELTRWCKVVKAANTSPN